MVNLMLYIFMQKQKQKKNCKREIAKDTDKSFRKFCCKREKRNGAIEEGGGVEKGFCFNKREITSSFYVTLI